MGAWRGSYAYGIARSFCMQRRVSWTKRAADLIRHRYAVAGKPRPRRPASRESRISSQVRFYFSDANLRRDRFMHTVFSKDPDGWVAVAELREFPILKRMRVSESEILNACDEEFFIVDSHQKRIRRDFDKFPNKEVQAQLATKSVPPPGQLSALDKRTVYIEGLPVVAQQEQVREYLLTQFPKIDTKYVSVPRHPITGESFGCAFVELGSEDEAKLVVRKFRRIDTDRFDAETGRTGTTVRVLTLGKFQALKKKYKQAKSLNVKNENRLTYFVGYDPERGRDVFHPNQEDDRDMEDQQRDEVSSSTSSDDASMSASTSSVLSDSDINSLAQDSVDVRRSRNASSIRSNSVVLITNLPPTTSANVRVWLAHSCAVQFLDHADNQPTAHARFSSKRERDFFIKDFANSKVPLRGCFPNVRPLTEDECLDYFEAERERRRSLLHSLGHPDSWANSTKRTRVSDGEGEAPRVSSSLPVLHGWESRKPSNGIAFTDCVAGNPGLGEPGTSMLHGIRRGRQIAREQFIGRARPEAKPPAENRRPISIDCDDSDHSHSRKRKVSPKDEVLTKRARVDSNDSEDEPILPIRENKRSRDQTKTYSPKKARPTIVVGKKTRRGCRGGKRRDEHRPNR